MIGFTGLTRPRLARGITSVCDSHIACAEETCSRTRILLAVDGYGETSSAVRAAVVLASCTASEVHVAHVVPRTPALPYLHLAAKEKIGYPYDRRRLKGLELLDDRVRRLEKELGRSVAASYYREGKPEKELVVLGKEIDAGLIMMGGQRQKRLERMLGDSPAEKVLRRAECPVLIVDDRDPGHLAVPR